MHRSLAALLGLLLVCAACADDGGGASPASGGSSVAVAAEPEGTQTFTDLERTHVDTPVDYPQTPPVGGPHNPV